MNVSNNNNTIAAAAEGAIEYLLSWSSEELGKDASRDEVFQEWAQEEYPHAGVNWSEAPSMGYRGRDVSRLLNWLRGLTPAQ